MCVSDALKGVITRYLPSFKKAKTRLCINCIPKIIVQFCFVRLNLGTGIVSCLLFLQMARMDMD